MARGFILSGKMAGKRAELSSRGYKRHFSPLRLGIGNRDALVGTVSDVNVFITHIGCRIYRVILKYPCKDIKVRPSHFVGRREQKIPISAKDYFHSKLN